MPILVLSVVIDMLGFGIILPLLPFYAQSFDASPQTITLLAACFSLAQFVCAPVWGWLSDRIGRRPVFLTCIAIAALAYGGLALADSLPLIFLARIAAGIGAGKIGVSQAMAVDLSTPDRRTRNLGMLGASFGVGMILGPIIGGVLTGSDRAHPNFHLPALAACAASLLALALGYFMIKESLPAHSHAVERRSILPWRGARHFTSRLLSLIGLFFAINFVFSQIETIFPLWLAYKFGWGAFEVGMGFTGIGVVIVLTQGVAVARISRLIGEEKLFLVGIVNLTIGTIMVPFAATVPLFALSAFFTASGFASINPTLQSLVSRAAVPTEQGATMGVAQSAGSLGRVLGPGFGGWLFELYSPAMPYHVGGGVLAVVLLLSGLMLLRPVRRTA